MEHVRLILVESIQGTNGEHSKEKSWRCLCGVERRRMQERQVVVEEAEVRGQVSVQSGKGRNTEPVQECTIGIISTDVVQDAIPLIIIQNLWGLEASRSLYVKGG